MEKRTSIVEDFERFIKQNGFLEFSTKDMEWGNTKKITLDINEFRKCVSVGK